MRKTIRFFIMVVYRVVTLAYAYLCFLVSVIAVIAAIESREPAVNNFFMSIILSCVRESSHLGQNLSNYMINPRENRETWTVGFEPTPLWIENKHLLSLRRVKTPRSST